MRNRDYSVDSIRAALIMYFKTYPKISLAKKPGDINIGGEEYGRYISALNFLRDARLSGCDVIDLLAGRDNNGKDYDAISRILSGHKEKRISLEDYLKTLPEEKRRVAEKKINENRKRIERKEKKALKDKLSKPLKYSWEK